MRASGKCTNPYVDGGRSKVPAALSCCPTIGGSAAALLALDPGTRARTTPFNFTSRDCSKFCAPAIGVPAERRNLAMEDHVTTHIMTLLGGASQMVRGIRAQ